jgi:crossover junction endodeoxyribonuclease RuvC
MNFLGIDPGYGRLGYGIVSSTENPSRPGYITSGVIETPSDISESARLLELEKNILPLLSQYPIKFCAVEQVFFKKNLTTGIQLIQARGIVLLCLEKFSISHVSVTPTSLKKLVTGSGTANKKQIESIIKKLLSLDNIPGPDDAADGLSLAIFAWLHYRTHQRIK